MFKNQFGLALVIAASVSTFSLNLKAANFSEQVDNLFSSIDSAAQPGCSVGVIEKGRLIHRSGYGLANMELNVKLDGSHVHRVGSVSKQFTAMAVLLLAEEGKIDLQADIRQYLPALKDYGVKVSVNAMLGHFAGMADYDFISGGDRGPVKNGLNIKSVAGGPFRLGNEDYLTIKEFYDVVKKAPLRHKPDQKWDYSNLAYFLLSMLVEEVSGETIREYAEKRIFKPLGMRHTFFSDQPTEIVRNRASGYKPAKEGGYVTDMTNLFWVGDGGIHTTVDDMLKWDQNFYHPKVGKNPKQLLALFNKPNSDYEARGGGLYANGQMITDKDGRKSYAHGGGWLGVLTYYERFPEHQFSTIVFCNTTDQKPWEFAKQIADLYFNQ
ncbi:beta-lactamase family protein [Aliikangiella marina]|uniref:Beta-lactamase family protein n=1 Tax=Aliikangiella marina TaxID=1712262 RepID=A0A545THT9_9GAMM|nr:serine hydrolase domain-containing protein [Aliikangiella marina]TQV76765.1 beta-lactamase family protein [Aliikangiella marina]